MINYQKGVNTKIDEIIKFATNLSGRDLELLASVHFWAEKQQEYLDEYTTDYILGKLTDLKPDANFKRIDVERTIKKLENSSFLAKNDDNSQD